MSGLLTHAWFSGLISDPEIAGVLSPRSELVRYRDVEIAWTLALADVGDADISLCERAASHIRDRDIPDEVLRAGVQQDGIPIPAFVGLLKKDISENIKGVIHIGLTSQDVMDTAFSLALRPILTFYRQRLVDLATALDHLSQENSGHSLMGYTRMQAALPLTAAARISTWARPLRVYIADIDRIANRMDVVQWGGPVGMRNMPNASLLGTAFAARLGLRDPGFAWHTNRADIAELGSFIARLTGSLGKMGQDIAMMAQRGPQDIRLSSGGSSSAMPHKRNPILAELLVTIAYLSAQQAALLNGAMVHEQERSGVAWMLEMITLPDMLQMCGCALRTGQSLTQQITTVGAGSE